MEGIDLRPMLKVSVAVIGVAGLWQVYGQWLNNRTMPEVMQIQVAGVNGWKLTTPFSDWHPHWVGAARDFEQTYAKSGKTVMLRIDYYPTQRRDHQLINTQNFMIKQKHKVWSNVGESLVDETIDGQSMSVRQAHLRSSGQRLLIWQWNVIHGQVVNNDYLGKLILAWNEVRGSRDDGASVLIATPYSDTEEGARAVLSAFAADMNPSIKQELNVIAVK